MAVSINLGMSKDGESISKSISYINDEATDAQIYNFVSAFSALSKNTLSSVSKITTAKIINPSTLIARTILISASAGNDYLLLNLSYPGDGNLSVSYESNSKQYPLYNLNKDNKTLESLVSDDALESGHSITFTFNLPQTDDYQAATATYVWSYS